MASEDLDKQKLFYGLDFDDNEDVVVTLKWRSASKKNKGRSEARKFTSHSHDGKSYWHTSNVSSSKSQSCGKKKGNVLLSAKGLPVKSSAGIRKVPHSLDLVSDDEEEDNIPLSARLSRIPNLQTSSCKFDDSVKKKPATLPVKRSIGNSNSLHISVKKSKVSLCDDKIPISQRMKRSSTSADKSPSKKKKLNEIELALVEKSIEECKRKRLVEEQTLHSLKRDIEEYSKELEIKKNEVSCVQGQLSSYSQHIEMKEKGYGAIQRSIEELNSELEAKGEQLKSVQKLMGECDMQLRLKEEECNRYSQHIEIKERKCGAIQRCLEELNSQFEAKGEQLKSVQKLISECDTQLRLKEEECNRYSQHTEMKERECGAIQRRIEELNSEFEAKGEQLKSVQNLISECDMQLRLKEEECNRVQDMMQKVINEYDEAQKKMQRKIEECDKDLEVKEVQLNLVEDSIRDCELELKTKETEFHQVLDNIDKECERKEEELDALFKRIVECTKELKTKEEELEAKQTLIDGLAKELESERKNLLKVISVKTSHLKDFESLKKQFEERVIEQESKENKFEGWVKELKSKERQHEDKEKELKSKEEEVERQAKELESKQKHFEERVKEFESKEKQHEALMKSFEEEKVLDNQSSPTVSGRSLQLLFSEGTDYLGSHDNDILSSFQASSDPAEVVLDIIKNPIAPECRERDNAISIDGSHIFLLEQLLRISPPIKPHVREEAMKLALDLKANVSASTENSLVVLGFLLLLSIFGLVSSFDEDEILKLFECAAHHKQAIELFRTLGFAYKVSDFVQNLIKKQQYIEAVRFICAYNLADKIQPVDLLREYVQNVKWISESSCEKAKCIEIKDIARDQEIASLGTALQCIAENNLESEDIRDEIQARIIELNWQKAK